MLLCSWHLEVMEEGFVIRGYGTGGGGEDEPQILDFGEAVYALMRDTLNV